VDSGEVERAASEACDLALGAVGSRAEALVACAIGPESLTRFANSRIHQNVSVDDARVLLLVVRDGRRSRASTTRLDLDGITALVERTLAAAALRPPDDHEPGLAPGAPAGDVAHWDEGTAGAGPEERALLVRAFVDAGSGLAGGEAAGFCSTESTTHVLRSTTGADLTARTSKARLDGIHRAATSGDPADGWAQATSARLADLDGAGCGTVAAAKAAASVEAVELPPGDYEVVLEPKAVAEALVFPAWLGFNGKSHLEGTSFVHLGEAQLDASISLWDDATDARALGRPYDAEGTPKARTDLVRDGVVVGVVHDRRTAARAGVDSTGHSLGLDDVGALPTDLFLAGGDRSPEALVGDVERGLLVTDLWYNRILDPKTQVVTGLTRNGLFLIERGEVVGAVRNLRYTQSIVAAFGPGRVLGLGDDARAVPTDVGVFHVPSARLAAWSFTGGASG
jgi:predicted Zn-dependent protease